MPSPFPGMNPYLEQDSVWHDFHQRALTLAADLIGAQVLPRYFVKIDEHMFVDELGEEQRRFIGRGDLWVAPLTPEGRGAGTAELLEAPFEVGYPQIDMERLSYLEIRDRDHRQLITVVELLSPSSKYSGRDRDQYLAKRGHLLHTNVHFVEIDLLDGGPRMPWLDMPACDYCAVVSRIERHPKAGFLPIRLRDRLPVIPVPLRQGDPDARLDLQEVLNRVYDAAGYHYYIYADQPTPQLSAEDAEWARQFVPLAGAGQAESP
jgi:hypothetical protein